MSYRGRLAPSPTGYLHAGHARTFHTAFRRARAAGGVLVMRIDDLDRERSRAGYVAAALEDLRWLGIDWDEGPDVGGPCAPYEQSRRGEGYRELWRRLLEGGWIYPCRCSRRDLSRALSAPHEDGPQADEEPVYPGTCRPPGAAARTCSLEDPLGTNWRLRLPDGEPIAFTDLHLGPRRLVAGVDFGDFLVWRRDRSPSYQLACVADDAAMGITEVVRGADLVTSTARQILLYRALGLPIPSWFHTTLLTDASGRRLAKRHDALSVRALRARGLSPAEVLDPDLRPPPRDG